MAKVASISTATWYIPSASTVFSLWIYVDERPLAELQNRFGHDSYTIASTSHYWLALCPCLGIYNN